jgi:hypothetical protein
MLAACAATYDRGTGNSQPAPGVFVAIDNSTADFRPTAEAVSRERLKKLGVSFAPDEASAAPLKLDLRLEYRNMTDSEFETIWRTTTFLLATLYPSTCRHRSYTLTASLADADGHTRTYEESDSTVAWMWLFQGPHCGDTPSKSEMASVTRQLLDAIYDRMIRDKAFAPNSLATAEPQTPLVHVATNRGQEIVRQVLRVDRPFERWTLTEDSAAAPDYRVDLYFDLKPGGFSVQRAYLAIMTAGLSGMCHSTPITLIATVTSPKATRSMSYTAAESVRGHYKGSDCELQDDTTRPDVFARLTRDVFAKLERDHLIKPGMPSLEHGAPWVLVTSNIAKGIVRAETIRLQPMPRYLFSNAAEYSPSYSLSMKIEFKGGGRKEPSTAGEIGRGLAIAWFGRDAGCNPGVLVLDSVLQDAANSDVKRYHLSREFKYSGHNEKFNCEDNEISNPEIVADSLRSLYGEMKADGTLALLSAR